MTTRRRKPPELPPIEEFPSLEPGRSTKGYASDSQAPFQPLVTRPPTDELEEDDEASLPPLPKAKASPVPWVVAGVVALVAVAGGLYALL